MNKGKYGVCLWFYAALAFVLAFLGQTLLCMVLLGFVLVAEKDEWTSRQAMQATFLSLVVSLLRSVLGLFDVLQIIPVFGALIGRVFGYIGDLVSIVVLVFVILALVRVVRGRDADLPLLSTLTDRVFGVVAQKVYTQAPPTGYQPPYQAPYGQQPHAPQQPPVQQPVQPQQPNQGPDAQ